MTTRCCTTNLTGYGRVVEFGTKTVTFVPNITVSNTTAGQKSGGGRIIFYGRIVAADFGGRNFFGGGDQIWRRGLAMNRWRHLANVLKYLRKIIYEMLI